MTQAQYRRYLEAAKRRGQTSATSIHRVRPISVQGEIGGTHPAFVRKAAS